MTKLITAVLIVLALLGAWRLLLYWDRVKNETDDEANQAKAAIVRGEQLQGMPFQLQASFEKAEAQGASGLRDWLKAYGSYVEDPRKAWIQLDYCNLLARDDPGEAKRIYQEVKARTPPNSPIWPRLKQLAKTYE